MSSKPKTKKPKTVLDMIIYAIRNQPANANGVSRTAISKYLKHEFEYDKATQLKNTLKKNVEKGRLIQTGQSLRVAGDPIPERPSAAKVRIEEVKEGNAPFAASGDTVVVKYEGALDDGSVFDAASSFEFVLGAGDVIKGWDQGIASMGVGGQRKLFVPSTLGYGKRGSSPDIPPNADLHFTVTLKKIR